MTDGFLELMWQQAENWRLVAAAVCGVIVGIIYFYSMRWSINRMGELAHKMKFFAVTALLRIALFFGVLVMIGQRNAAVILLYVLAFFLTKVVIIGLEKKKYVSAFEEENKKP
ncbi:MAG: hypothetical protein IKN71_01770 [Alphaproteobacteria bacterium]|nr:hypothetical protein [Alphaproteobacteria bacterium]